MRPVKDVDGFTLVRRNLRKIPVESKNQTEDATQENPNRIRSTSGPCKRDAKKSISFELINSILSRSCLQYLKWYFSPYLITLSYCLSILFHSVDCHVVCIDI
jgi:hypothetical protein